MISLMSKNVKYLINYFYYVTFFYVTNKKCEYFMLYLHVFYWEGIRPHLVIEIIWCYIHSNTYIISNFINANNK